MTARKPYEKSLKQEMIQRLAAGESPEALNEESKVPVRTLKDWKKLIIEPADAHTNSLNVVGDDLRYKILIEENKAAELRYKILKEESNSRKEESNIRIIALLEQLVMR